jgi:hypothetical protein
MGTNKTIGSGYEDAFVLNIHREGKRRTGKEEFKHETATEVREFWSYKRRFAISGPEQMGTSRSFSVKHHFDLACASWGQSYCEIVKNVTVSLPDEVYRKARIKAAERNTSLSSLVKMFLESLADDEGEFKRLERLQEESYSKIECFQASRRITREELHRRGNLH